MAKRDIGLTVSILALLVLLGGAGEYNYQRNKAAEERSAPRAYRAYSNQEIAALIQAYEREVGALESRYQAAKSSGQEVRGGGLIDEQIAEFERAQREGASTRSAGGEVAQHQAVLRELRRELSLRGGGLDSIKIHLRRMFSI
jgi:hypothetical protein